MTSTPTALVCREVFDENSQPSAEEISEYAQQIGIDPTTEGHLLPLARDGLMQALPPPWKAYYDDKLKTHYFYNSETNVTQWDHPLDQVYKNLVIKAKHSSDRGDSILDDTCISIQDLVTFEEDAKQITTDRCETKDMEAQDSSIESSLEEEDETDRKPKTSADIFRGVLRKPGVLAPIGRKPLPPMMGIGDRKLGDIMGLTKKPGESNTFPRTAQTSMAKFKVGILQQKDFNDGSFDNSDSDTHDSYSKKGSDAKIMNVPLAPSNRIKKHTSEIIDLSFNPSGYNDSVSRDGSSLYDAPKRGLTLSGGGSIFLKSNKSSQQIDNDGMSFGSLGKTSNSNTGDNPKGILRERSFGESAFRIPSLDKSEGSRGNDHTVSEEDRKSVRFNLDQKEVDFQYDYSPSPSSNSSSDILQGKQGSVIAVNKAEVAKAEPPSVSNVALVRRNSDTSGLNSDTPTFLKARKLRPLNSEDNIKVKPSIPTSGFAVAREQSFTEENKFDSSVTNSPTRKLIKPLPGDFIKPSLFQKPFEKLSDILKPTSPDTDSDSEVLVNRPKPPVIKNKLSINLMESVDSEASVESPDKESVNLETTSSYDYPKVVEKPNNLSLSLLAEKKKATDIESNKIGARESFRRSSVSRMSAFGDFNSEKSEEAKKLESELAVKRDREVVEAKIKMEAELKKTRADLEEQQRREIFILKEQLNREHANNKAKLEKAIKETKKNQDKIVEQALNDLLMDFDKLKDRSIEEEKSKLSIDLSSQMDKLREEHSNSIERLKEENKTNLQKIFNNMEHENKKAINELGQQYADNLEAEKLRLMAENKSALDKMKNEHESLCDELKKDYRSEIELVRSQQAAHLSALRERMRREREYPLSTSSTPVPTGPSSPPREEVAYERLRCDKRLLEDKYRCLKEKYARLKSDVKISIERRNKRREQSLTTGSETEKSHSNKIAGLGDKSGDITDTLNSINKMDPRKRILSNNNNPINGALRLTNNGITKAEMHAKPHDNNNATPILINPSRDINLSLSDSTPHHNGSGINNHLLNVAGRNDSLNRISPDHSRVKSSSFREKSPLGKVSIREKSFGNGDNDNSLGLNDISLSQSDSHTVSNSRHAKKVQLIDNHKDKYCVKDGADSRSKGALRKSLKINPEYIETTVTDYQDSSDTGISDHLQGRESLLGRNRKKLFTRLKSASTSRLNYTVSPKSIDSSCSPLENLRQQLRKLEELEEQFPDVTLNADTTAYRLRYPFPDSGGGGELGFLRHRALVEREGVRRARAALRRRRHNLRQRRASPHAAWQVRQDTVNQDECELTDMEVSLHRTKSVLGEKVIRLRHIEKSLRQLQAEREGKDPATEDATHKQEHKDTTLSDISSHSSGFSSTEAQSDGNPSGRHTTDHDAEIISSLQTLNTEIRDIWQVLNAQQQLNVAKVFPIGQLLYTDVGWQLPIAASNIPTLQHLPNSVATGFAPAANVPAINSIAAESSASHFRVHGGFRQIAPVAMRPIPTAVVAQPPLPSGVATSLVERTRDLRDWLKQQAAL